MPAFAGMTVWARRRLSDQRRSCEHSRREDVAMLKTTRDLVLPTAITGSYPRPLWFDLSLNGRSFKSAMGETMFREQYTDAVACIINAQEAAGLDIVTDGDSRFDLAVGGKSWFFYPIERLGGVTGHRDTSRGWMSRHGLRPGKILWEVQEAYQPGVVTERLTRGPLEYAALWKVAQRLTDKPVKFGGVSAEIVAFALQDRYYKSVPERMFAIADALNEEYHELADAGCPVIQIEEPQIHLIAVRKIVDKVINPQLMVEVFNRTVKGLRAKTEVWAHSCWGNPSQQRMFAEVQSYKPALEAYNTVDADVITFESSSSGGIDLEAIGKTITDKKISIGVIDHHTLQVEQPEQVAAQIRAALKYIPAERLMVSTDCGMGREGMSRRHAFYKAVAITLGTNIVRKELGVKEARIPAADERYSLVVPTK
jgi:5-methyltetrahydropteroyltriglutamate--homocysteine methyltransferase